ncbi:MAG: DUF5688 family protein [Clostridiales bacterium]|nr:DUF5688 family protein [Clostridiales bacterium]
MVLARLAEDIPNPKKITVQRVYRNNGDFMDGLVILEGGVNIGPALYLDYYYRTLNKGSSFAAVYRDIIAQYERNRATGRINVDFFTDYEKVKSRIVMKLINREKNAEFLTDVPHIDYLDLSVVFVGVFPVDSDIGNASIMVRNAHMMIWEQHPDTLYETAKVNTIRLMPPRLRQMSSLMHDLASLPDYPTVPIPDDPLYPMYVLTNNRDYFGAANMVYTELISSYADKFQADFYILPSSIHEVILVPTASDDRLADFSKMVSEVNAGHVENEDILADHAYYYSRRENAITF